MGGADWSSAALLPRPPQLQPLNGDPRTRNCCLRSGRCGNGRGHDGEEWVERSPVYLTHTGIEKEKRLLVN